MSQSILILCSEFNINVSSALLEGALQHLKANLDEKSIKTVWVPGAFELPTAASVAIETEKYDAIICLGSVIKGESAHFEHVAGCCAQRISELGVDAGIPVIFGVLTTHNLHQALERSGQTADGRNHGKDYAEAALKMLKALEEIED